MSRWLLALLAFALFVGPGGVRLAHAEPSVSPAPQAGACVVEAIAIDGADWAGALPAIAIDADCHYTNTEIVIIVIGFIFGILPGILFLFLLC